MRGNDLTTKQRAIYEYLREGLELHQRIPTIRDIGARFGIESTNGVMCHIKALHRKGWVECQHGRIKIAKVDVVLFDHDSEPSEATA